MISIQLPPKLMTSLTNDCAINYLHVKTFNGRDVQVLNWHAVPEVREWLADHNIPYNILDIRTSNDISWSIGGQNVFLGFTNEEDALLFKLTWL